MPVYIVSWSDGECMLVRCRDEDDLIYRLDQIGDPARATWMVYGGPFTISLHPEIDRSDAEPTVTYASELVGGDAFELCEAVTEFAFPKTCEAERKAGDREHVVDLELLLQSEIAIKGVSEKSLARLDVWIVNASRILLHVAQHATLHCVQGRVVGA